MVGDRRLVWGVRPYQWIQPTGPDWWTSLVGESAPGLGRRLAARLRRLVRAIRAPAARSAQAPRDRGRGADREGRVDRERHGSEAAAGTARGALATLGQPAVVATKYAPPATTGAPLFGLGLRGRLASAAETRSPFRHEYNDQHRETTLDAVGDAFTAEDARGWIAGLPRRRRLGTCGRAQAARISRSGRWPSSLADAGAAFDGQGLVRPGRTGARRSRRALRPAPARAPRRC